MVSRPAACVYSNPAPNVDHGGFDDVISGCGKAPGSWTAGTVEKRSQIGATVYSVTSCAHY
jgi:hypothetical protein